MVTTRAKTQVSAEAAAKELRVALADVGVVLPSLGVDYGLALDLVELGRVNPETAQRLAAVIRRGSAS